MLKRTLIIGGSALLFLACGGSENPDDSNGSGGTAGTAGTGQDGGSAGTTNAAGADQGGAGGGAAAGSGTGGEAGLAGEPVDAPPLAWRLSTEDDLNCAVTYVGQLYCWAGS